MKTKTTVLLVWAFLCFALINTSHAQTKNQSITSNLEVFRITKNAQGKEVAQKAPTIQPGDTLEYRLTYTNNLSGSVSNLQATLPVPAGVQYMGGTAQPAINMASLNAVGESFQALPIQRNETQPDGSVHKVTVPATEYRRLRWTVPNIASQGSVTLSARVQVINVNRL